MPENGFRVVAVMEDSMWCRLPSSLFEILIRKTAVARLNTRDRMSMRLGSTAGERSTSEVELRGSKSELGYSTVVSCYSGSSSVFVQNIPILIPHATPRESTCSHQLLKNQPLKRQPLKRTEELPNPSPKPPNTVSPPFQDPTRNQPPTLHSHRLL